MPKFYPPPNFVIAADPSGSLVLVLELHCLEVLSSASSWGLLSSLRHFIRAPKNVSSNSRRRQRHAGVSWPALSALDRRSELWLYFRRLSDRFCRYGHQHPKADRC